MWAVVVGGAGIELVSVEVRRRRELGRGLFLVSGPVLLPRERVDTKMEEACPTRRLLQRSAQGWWRVGAGWGQGGGSFGRSQPFSCFVWKSSCFADGRASSPAARSGASSSGNIGLCCAGSPCALACRPPPSAGPPERRAIRQLKVRPFKAKMGCLIQIFIFYLCNGSSII